MRFRKKPIEVEARELTHASIRAVAVWCGGELRLPASNGHPAASVALDWRHPYVVIPTLEGEMRGELGDWIICGVKGEFYPCKPDIFAATYEPAEETTSAGQEGRMSKIVRF